MGCIGGSIYYVCRGIIHAPREGRIRGGIWNAKFRSPVMGGSFAQWGFTFSMLDCMLSSVRKEEGPINSIIAGAGTGAILSFQEGLRQSLRSGAIGGVILAVIEGVNYKYMSYVTKQNEMITKFSGDLQEERLRRQTAGQADFTPDQINALAQRVIAGEKLDLTKEYI